MLVHGLTASSDTWWQVGPALAARGFDVTAVDQTGHGDHALDGPVGPEILVDAVLAAVPGRPQVLVGHSLGAVTALALLAREPGWVKVVVLEDPPCIGEFAPEAFTGLVAAGVRADAAAVRANRAAVVSRIREDCPRWAEEDVEHAVRGIERMNGEAFATWLESTDIEDGAFDTVARVLEVRPDAARPGGAESEVLLRGRVGGIRPGPGGAQGEAPAWAPGRVRRRPLPASRCAGRLARRGRAGGWQQPAIARDGLRSGEGRERHR